jgi:hypothetical protein
MSSRFRCSWCGDVPVALIYGWLRGQLSPSLEDAMCEAHYLPGPPTDPNFVIVPADSTMEHVRDMFYVREVMAS